MGRALLIALLAVTASVAVPDITEGVKARMARVSHALITATTTDGQGIQKVKTACHMCEDGKQ